MFDKHFTEMLKSEMFKDLELGGSALTVLPNTMGGGTTGDGGTVGVADVAVFSGSILEYTFTVINFVDSGYRQIKALLVKDNVANRDGSDLLVGIEKANFSDATNVTILGTTNNAPIGAATALLADGTEDISYTVTAAQLLAGFVDVDGNALSVTGLSAGTNGSVVDNGNGTFTITPLLNYNGTVTLNYTVDDGNLGAVGGVQTFSLAAINDAPLLTSTQAVLPDGSEDISYTVTIADLLAGFTDVDLGETATLTVTPPTAPNATVVLDAGGLSYTITQSINDYNGLVTLSYNVVDINNASLAASLSYTVTQVNDTPSGIVTIDDISPDLNQILLASNTLADLDGLGPINYQWQSLNTSSNLWENIGTNSVSFLTTNAQVGRQLHVVASYTDGSGNTEVITSNDTATVGAFNIINGTTNPETINGTVLRDRISGNGGNDVLNGLGSDDELFGAEGNDKLDGGIGADTLAGGIGNDTYVVDNAGDVVVEDAGGDTDRVYSSITYDLGLGSNVENLTLTGTAAINGTGNELNNTIVGNSASNILTGGAGHDTYVVDNAGDVVVEDAGGGTDRVNSSITYDLGLGSNVENLTLTGSASIDGTGNELNNTIIGNSASNTLSGGSGSDTINGGSAQTPWRVVSAMTPMWLTMPAMLLSKTLVEIRIESTARSLTT